MEAAPPASVPPASEKLFAPAVAVTVPPVQVVEALGGLATVNPAPPIDVRLSVNVMPLSADAFGTSDCKFQLKDLDGTAAGFDALGATVADDPVTVCDESKLLLRMPDGTIQYRQANSVDPPGINKQAVYNGTTKPDRVWGGNGNDTFWGLTGDDVIEGGGGIDNALGGEGDDIITDLSGADILKGGPGNDRIFVRDGEKDTVDCGKGSDDRVVADKKDKVKKNCETVSRKNP